MGVVSGVNLRDSNACLLHIFNKLWTVLAPHGIEPVRTRTVFLISERVHGLKVFKRFIVLGGIGPMPFNGFADVFKLFKTYGRSDIIHMELVAIFDNICLTTKVLTL